jgi:hypothetical protein
MGTAFLLVSCKKQAADEKQYFTIVNKTGFIKGVALWG